MSAGESSSFGSLTVVIIDCRPTPLPASLFPLPYAVNELPHPHPPVAFGFLNVNPEPCMDVT